MLESVRRLRLTNLVSEVILEGVQCEAGRTDFTIWTRDAWSLRTGFRFADAGTARIAVSETNLFGTGRTVGVSADQIDDRRSISVTLADPYLFDTRMSGAATLRNYPDGRTWSWNIHTRELSPRDRWRGSIAAIQSRRFDDNPGAHTHTDIKRRVASVTGNRLFVLTHNQGCARVVGLGTEYDELYVCRPGDRRRTRTARRERTDRTLGR